MFVIHFNHCIVLFFCITLSNYPLYFVNIFCNSCFKRCIRNKFIIIFFCKFKFSLCPNQLLHQNTFLLFFLLFVTFYFTFLFLSLFLLLKSHFLHMHSIFSLFYNTISSKSLGTYTFPSKFSCASLVYSSFLFSFKLSCVCHKTKFLAPIFCAFIPADFAVS